MDQLDSGGMSVQGGAFHSELAQTRHALVVHTHRVRLLTEALIKAGTKQAEIDKILDEASKEALGTVEETHVSFFCFSFKQPIIHIAGASHIFL